MSDSGPTPAMRNEHRQIGQQLEAIHRKVETLNVDSDQEEQGNRKEERALYPAIDQVASAEERDGVFLILTNVPEERYKLCCGEH